MTSTRLSEIALRIIAGEKGILQQNGMPLLQARGEQAVAGNDRMREAIGDRHQHGFLHGIHLRDDFFIQWIHGQHAAQLDRNLGLIFAEGIQFVGESGELFRGRENAHRFTPAERKTLHAHLRRSPAAITECIIAHGLRGTGQRRTRRLGFIGRDERLRDGNFVHRILCQRDANRVANAIAEQTADADGALDAPVLAVAGLRNAEVDGIVPVCALTLQFRHQQPVGLDHHLGIRRLHAEEEIVIVQPPRDAGKLQRALHHAAGSITVAVHDAVAETAVIRTDAHGHAALLA